MGNSVTSSLATDQDSFPSFHVSAAIIALDRDLRNDPSMCGYDGSEENFDRLQREILAISKLEGVFTHEQIVDKFWNINLEITEGKREVDWYL